MTVRKTPVIHFTCFFLLSRAIYFSARCLINMDFLTPQCDDIPLEEVILRVRVKILQDILIKRAWVQENHSPRHRWFQMMHQTRSCRPEQMTLFWKNQPPRWRWEHGDGWLGSTDKLQGRERACACCLHSFPLHTFTMVDSNPQMEPAQCPSYAAGLGYLGVAAAVCLSNWGSAVGHDRRVLDGVCHRG